jgi:hypothetical protein
MHLLKQEFDGELTLIDTKAPDPIPNYAILSHRWAKNPSDEVTFQDLKAGIDKEKLGYEKLRFCAKQAKADKLEHFWIDTCCIDKSSSAELAEAINSMYRWYEAAAVCYVYLTDVNWDDNGDDVNKSFTHSEWFERGWTLQELIAPSEVIFFDDLGNELGRRDNLAETIAARTHINKEVLQFHDGKRQADISCFSVAQRMSWASQRTTTRVEDRAYSLLGIFNVNLPLLYGEGEKAFLRLQEEIVRSSADQSILAWGLSDANVEPWAPEKEINSFSNISSALNYFARSPSDFAQSGRVLSISPSVSDTGQKREDAFSVTNQGLRITLPTIEQSMDNDAIGILACRYEHNGAYLGFNMDHNFHERETAFIRSGKMVSPDVYCATIAIHPRALVRAKLLELTISNCTGVEREVMSRSEFSFWSITIDWGPLSRCGYRLRDMEHVMFNDRFTRSRPYGGLSKSSADSWYDEDDKSNPLQSFFVINSVPDSNEGVVIIFERGESRNTLRTNGEAYKFAVLLWEPIIDSYVRLVKLDSGTHWRSQLSRVTRRRSSDGWADAIKIENQNGAYTVEVTMESKDTYDHQGIRLVFDVKDFEPR